MTNNKRPPLDFDAIKIAATGNWVSTIYPAVGIQFDKHHKKHQPCPVCGGTDRFRCDDKNGSGSWICSHCGSGDGFKLVGAYTHTTDNYELFKLIGGILGVSATQTITPEQRQAWKDEQIAREQREAAAKLQQQNATAEQANARWANASMTGQSDYVMRKQIQPFEARFEGNNLLVPVVAWTDGQQVLRSIQTIKPDGAKEFMAGGQVKGCYCPIGLAEQFINPSVVLICEGYATGASIFMAINHSVPVFAAFNAGNLSAVGEVVRTRYPNARILFCADNDAQTAQNTGKNPGVDSATAAALAVSGEVVIPDFTVTNDKAVA